MKTLVPTVGRYADVKPRDLMDDFRRATPRQVLEIIRTDYVGPTDDTGSHTVAESLITGITGEAAWDYALNQDENHLAAAVAALTPSICDWELISRQVQSTDTGYVFTFQYVARERY